MELTPFRAKPDYNPWSRGSQPRGWRTAIHFFSFLFFSLLCYSSASSRDTNSLYYLQSRVKRQKHSSGIYFVALYPKVKIDHCDRITPKSSRLCFLSKNWRRRLVPWLDSTWSLLVLEGLRNHFNLASGLPKHFF